MKEPCLLADEELRRVLADYGGPPRHLSSYGDHLGGAG
jgi:hypothetical protein